MRLLVSEDREHMRRRCIETLRAMYRRAGDSSPEGQHISSIIETAESLPPDAIAFVEGLPLSAGGPSTLLPIAFEFNYRVIHEKDWTELVHMFQVSEREGLFLLVRNDYVDKLNSYWRVSRN